MDARSFERSLPGAGSRVGRLNAGRSLAARGWVVHREVKQTKIVRILLFAAVLSALLATAAWPHRRILGLRIIGLVEGPPPLSEPSSEPESVTWFDDYFTIEFVDAQTIAIGEPRYWQQNYSYLILGSNRAILFDSGPGLRNIKPVVESLTDLPVTVASSHLHYDHVGNHNQFDRVALVDLPHLRERAQSGVFRPSSREHLGFMEGFDPPALAVSEWWAPESQVDLGSRALSVIHAPGMRPSPSSFWIAIAGSCLPATTSMRGRCSRFCRART